MFADQQLITVVAYTQVESEIVYYCEPILNVRAQCVACFGSVKSERIHCREVVNWIWENVSVLILKIRKRNCWIKTEMLIHRCDDELATELDVM